MAPQDYSLEPPILNIVGEWVHLAHSCGSTYPSTFAG